MTTIIPIERIHREATEAATANASLQDACPYPFYSPEGLAFKEAFETARARLQAEPEGARP